MIGAHQSDDLLIALHYQNENCHPDGKIKVGISEGAACLVEFWLPLGMDSEHVLLLILTCVKTAKGLIFVIPAGVSRHSV
ncbi:MAG: hypothetical protein AAGF86_12615, partial [Pseudomonadota bacterium]